MDTPALRYGLPLSLVGLLGAVLIGLLLRDGGPTSTETPPPPLPSANIEISPERSPTPPPAAANPSLAQPDGEPSPPVEDTAQESVLPEVLLGMGAEAFLAGDMETARRHLRAIVDEAPDHRMAPYAAYKLAWCEANLDDHAAAVVEMQRVVRWLRDDGRPEESVTLREALMDLEHLRSQLDTGG
jgi:hypothetical protein